MTTDWWMFGVQLFVGLVTLYLAWTSVRTAKSAARIAKESNQLSESSLVASSESAAASNKSADVAERMLNIEAERTANASEQAKREQASHIWVSMIAISKGDGEDELGVLRIRNSSDQPVTRMRIQSRGWSKAKKYWFDKDACAVPVVYPGDTIVRSLSKPTDWAIPETYFPHYEGTYHPMVGPVDDPYYVTAVLFDDADGNAWRLDGGHRLKSLEDE